MEYPTELIELANFEINLFERPSVDTSKLLIAEVLKLREKVKELEAENADLSLSVSRLAGIIEDLDYRPDC